MVDVASLSVKVTSDGVEKTTAGLNNLAVAANKADTATENLEASTKGLSAGANKAATDTNKMGASAKSAAGSMQRLATTSNEVSGSMARTATGANSAASAVGKVATAANSNVKSLGGSMSGLAAQFQDIGVSAAGGMSPMLIALQQGTQIAGTMEAALQGGASASAVFGQAIMSLISPVSLLSIGLTAVAAAGLQMVDWSKLASTALTTLANVMQTIAPYAAMVAAGLALIYAPAVIGGIVQLIALLGRLMTTMIATAATFAAANPATAFVLGITAAVAAANIFRDELAGIFGRDIVADAKNAVNTIIGTFVGGYQGIKAAWSNLPAALGDITYSTANAVIKGVENMINSIIEKLNSFISGAYNSISGMASKLGVDIGTFEGISPVSIGGIDNPYAGKANATESAIGSAIKSAQGKDYVGGFASMVAKGASMASSKLKELAADLTTVDEKTKKAGQDKEDPYAKITASARQFIEQQKLEAQAIGMTEEAANRMRYEQDMLNQAANDNISLTAAQKEEISGLAAQMASVEAETKRLKEAFDFAKDATKGFITDLRTGLQNGEGFFQSFGKAALNVLNKILSKIEDELVNALFSLGSSSSSGGGGLFGSILGGIGKLFGFAKGGAFEGGAQRFAKGSAFTNQIVNRPTSFRFAKGTGVMGEAGPEAIMPLGRDSSGRLGVYAKDGGSSGVQYVNVPYIVSVEADDNGSIKAMMKQVSGETVQQAAPSIVQAANKSAPSAVAQYQTAKAGGDYRMS